ncbi:MAG: M56 family metallopeptidase, partial [Planctomycetota bacterium]
MTELLNQIADKWLTWQLAIGWQVAVLIVIVAAIDFLIKKWAWPQLRYALWLLILIKLILPPTLTSSVSLTSNIPILAEKAIQIKAVTSQAIPQSPTLLEPITQPIESPAANTFTDTHIAPVKAVEKTNYQPAKAVSPTQILSWKAYVFIIWLVGIVVLASWLVIRLSNLRREHLKKENQTALPDRFNCLLERTAQKLKLKKAPQVILTNKVCCPAVFGVFKPVLLMPADKLRTLTREDTEHILLHELAHIKRGDLFVHAVYVILQILYWFNPFVWLIRKHLQN